MDLTPDAIQRILIGVFVLVASVAFHEFGHALMADRLGDDTPRRQGRVTLNPLAHADPIGTLLLPLIGGIYAASAGSVGGFGWGKPVQWQPSRINRKWHMSTAKILVAVAGPSMNILLAVLIAGTHTLLVSQGVMEMYSKPSAFLFYATATNFVLFFFNLIPAPPLDGGHVAEGMTPYKHREKFHAYAVYGPFVVMAVALIPQLNWIFLKPAKFCAEQLYDVMGLF